MFDTIGFHWIFENIDGLCNFKCTYLETQMELEGVLGLDRVGKPKLIISLIIIDIYSWNAKTDLE